MNNSLDNKKETIYRKAKDRKNSDNHKKGTGLLKYMVKQKGNRVN
jgi:hypothetical protein